MNTEQVVCPPGIKQWVIVKAGEEYPGGPGYAGPVCDDADVPAQQVYFSKRAATNDCQRLNHSNPDRFKVEPYRESSMISKKDFSAKLAEYYERWQDQRKEYVTDLMGSAAENGIMDFLHFIDPVRFYINRSELERRKEDVKEAVKESMSEGGPPPDIDPMKEVRVLAGVEKPLPCPSSPREVMFTEDGTPILLCTNIISLKGKGVIFMVKPTPQMPFANLMALAGKDVFVNGKYYRVINAESTDKGGKGDVGLVVQEKTLS